MFLCVMNFHLAGHVPVTGLFWLTCTDLFFARVYDMQEEAIKMRRDQAVVCPMSEEKRRV